MQKIFIILVLSVTFLMVGCRAKHVPPSAPSSEATYTAGEIRKALVDDYPEWSQVRLPIRVSIDGAASFSLSGRATIIRNEAISISFRMIGMEVAKAYIDSDSVLIADKYHKVLFAESVAKVSKSTGVILANIQDILLGIPAIVGATSLSESGVKALKVDPLFPATGQNEYLVSASGKFDYSYIAAFIGESINIRELAIAPSGRPSFVCQYSEAAHTPAGMLNASARIDTEINGKPLKAEVKWDFDKAEWNGQYTAERVRTKGYRVINATDILKLAGSTRASER